MNIRELLNKYDIPTNYLEGMFSVSVDKHTALNKALGLTKENAYRKIVEFDPLNGDDIRELHPEIYNWLYNLFRYYHPKKYIAKSIDLANMTILDRRKNTHKLTKVLTKLPTYWGRENTPTCHKTVCALNHLQFYDVEHHVCYVSRSRWTKNIFGESVKRKVEQAIYTYDFPDIQQVLLKLGEIKLTRVVGVISTNPYDMLNASQYTTNWRSCHAMDGEYFNTCIHNTACEASLIFYTTTQSDFKEWNEKDIHDITRFNGRSWGYVDLETGMIARMPMYGTLHKSHKYKLRHVIQDILPFEDYKTTATMRKSGRGVDDWDYLSFDHPDGAYMDSIQTLAIPSGTETHTKYINVGQGRCLACNDLIDEGEVLGQCNNCHTNYPENCAYCGDGCNDENYVEDEGYYCEYCRKTYCFYCDECGVVHHETPTEVRNHCGCRTNICDIQLERHYFMCTTCDEYHHIDNAHCHKDGDEFYCEDCFEPIEEEEDDHDEETIEETTKPVEENTTTTTYTYSANFEEFARHIATIYSD